MTTHIEALIREIENTPDMMPVEQVTLALAERLWGLGRETAALRTLSIVDPAEAAKWLLDERRAAGIAGARGALGGVVTSIADTCIATPEVVPHGNVLELIGRYGHLLAPDVALELATAMRRPLADAELQVALDRALTHAPSAPGLLRAAAEIAISRHNDAVGRDLLTRLAHADRSATTMRFVHKARRALPKTSDPEIRVALLSSFTIDPVIPYVDDECRSLRLEPVIYLAPFNTWEREMIGEGSLQQFAPQIAFLSVAADDVIPELAGAPSSTDLLAAGHAVIERILTSAERFLSWSSGVLVVHGLHSAFRDTTGPAAGRGDRSRAEILAELNAQLAAGLRGLPRAHLLDMHDVLAHRRQGAVDSPKMRHLASMRLSEHVLADLAGAYARYIAPVAGRTRKCIVLDLDNTLWGGIVGEDGPHGIRLGTSSPGSEYREFQQFLMSLAQRGMLLAVNSKNNPDDALEVIRNHESMILRENSFSALRINWESKAHNMLSLAEELSLGLDSFVFIDDSEKERALMRQTLPQVLTPELPRDPALYRETVERMAELHVLNVTAEDRSRTRQYIERRHRETLRVSSQSVDEYLQSLGIVAVTEEVDERSLTRVQQLFQRTNQFNLTTRRYELGALAARAGDPSWRLYATRVSDRFGDHGLVAAALAQVTPDAWIVDNLVMSCRVIGYGVEDALLARICRDARSAGAHQVAGAFIPSPKNAPARDYYSRNKFTLDPANGDCQRWERDVTAEPFAAPLWIQEEAPRGA